MLISTYVCFRNVPNMFPINKPYDDFFLNHLYHHLSTKPTKSNGQLWLYKAHSCPPENLNTKYMTCDNALEFVFQVHLCKCRMNSSIFILECIMDITASRGVGGVSCFSWWCAAVQPHLDRDLLSLSWILWHCVCWTWFWSHAFILKNHT